MNHPQVGDSYLALCSETTGGTTAAHITIDHVTALTDGTFRVEADRPGPHREDTCNRVAFTVGKDGLDRDGYLTNRTPAEPGRKVKRGQRW